MKIKHKIILTSLILSLSVTSAFAMSSGIRKNRMDECAIWLCLPSGFAQGCSAARSAFIGRVTDVDHKGHRKYTSLPAFPNCVDQDQTALDNNQHSTITDRTMYEIHMPELKEAAEWAWHYKEYSGYSGSDYHCDKYEKGRCYVKDYRYCSKTRLVSPARVFESYNAYHEYKTIEVGDRVYTEGTAPFRTFTEVLVDGVRTGQRWYY